MRIKQLLVLSIALLTLSSIISPLQTYAQKSPTISGKLSYKDPASKDEPALPEGTQVKITDATKSNIEFTTKTKKDGSYSIGVPANSTYNLTAAATVPSGTPPSDYSIEANKEGIKVGTSNITVNVVSDDITQGGSKSTNQSCLSGSKTGWVLCPIIEGIYNTLASLMGPDGGAGGSFFTRMLRIEALNTADDGSVIMKKIWTSFRTIANIAFVIVLLFIIFGQATGFVDAYTIKKALPRLVIAIILVQLSYFLCGIVIDIFNVIGAGVAGLILAPAQGMSAFKFNGDSTVFWSSVLGGSLVLYAGLAFGKGSSLITGLFVIFIGIFIGFVVALVVLVLRKIFIILMVILAPIAIVAWVLPGTEKIFKSWRGLLVKALMMYPIIVAMLAGGRLVGTMVSNGAGVADGGAQTIVGLISNFAPFFLIPYTFKWAGSFLAQAAQSLTKSMNKMKGDAHDQNSWRSRRHHLAAEKELHARQHFVAHQYQPHGGAQGGGHKQSLVPWKRQSRNGFGLNKALAYGSSRFYHEPVALSRAKELEHIEQIGGLEDSGDDTGLFGLVASRGDGKTRHGVTNEIMQEGKYYSPIDGSVISQNYIDAHHNDRDNSSWLRFSAGYAMKKANTKQQQRWIQQEVYRRATTDMHMSDEEASTLIRQIGDDRKYFQRQFRGQNVGHAQVKAQNAFMGLKKPDGSNYTEDEAYDMSMMNAGAISKMVGDSSAKEGFGASSTIAQYSREDVWRDSISGAKGLVERLRQAKLAEAGNQDAEAFILATTSEDDKHAYHEKHMDNKAIVKAESAKSRKSLNQLLKFEGNFTADITSRSMDPSKVGSKPAVAGVTGDKTGINSGEAQREFKRRSQTTAEAKAARDNKTSIDDVYLQFRRGLISSGAGGYSTDAAVDFAKYADELRNNEETRAFLDSDAIGK